MVFMDILLLQGICYIYIVFGTLDISSILLLVEGATYVNNYLLISLFFIFISFFFKIGIFPFHFYILDLYKTSSFAAVATFSILPKFVYFYIINFFVKIFLNLIIFDFYQGNFLLNILLFFFFFVAISSFFLQILKCLVSFLLWVF